MKNFINEDNIILNLDIEDKNEVINKMVDTVCKEELIDREKFISDILKRESLENTVVGFKVAIPHGKSKYIKFPKIVFAKLKKEVFWGDPDEMVKYIFLLGIPEISANEHIKMLMKLSKKILDEEFRKKLEDIEDKKEILEIILADKKYKIEDKNILKLLNDEQSKEYDINHLSEQNKTLLEKILAHKSANGSFEISEIQPLIDDFFDGQKPKGASNVKADLIADVLDTKRIQNFNISYNIKSNLGSPATLLNASRHTNFIYEITGIDDAIMNQSNNITTSKKLLDRCNFLKSQGAVFSFIQTESCIFERNLACKVLYLFIDDWL